MCRTPARAASASPGPNAIGVVLPDLHGEFFSEIVRGMDREASRRGYLLLLSNMHAQSGAGARRRSRRCAGGSTA